jgi:hypothetical protein
MVPDRSSVSPSQLGSGGSRGWTMMTIELVAGWQKTLRLDARGYVIGQHRDGC